MISLRAKTGVKELDDALEGGVRVGSFCLLSGPALSGRELLAQTFFHAGLEAGEAGTYVTTKEFAEDVIAQMAEHELDLSTHWGKYVFIDAYSPQSNPSLQDTATVKYVASVADFAKLSNIVIMGMSEFMGRGMLQQRLVFDSIDTLLMYVSPAGVYRFLSYLRAKTKSFRAVCFLLIQPELHEEKAVKTIIQLADMLIEMNPDTGQMSLASPGSPRVPMGYKIGEKALEVWRTD
ncbi:MAG: RAD55 family ATPase [Thermoplasmatota archaeon]